MINFKYMASWADDDGDEMNYFFIVPGVSTEDAYECAKTRTKTGLKDASYLKV